MVIGHPGGGNVFALTYLHTRSAHMTMRNSTILLSLALLASVQAQDAGWTFSAQFRNPIWGDADVLDRSAPTTYYTPGHKEKNASLAFGGVAERQWKNGCAVRIGFEHTRNSMDRAQLGSVPAWYPQNSTTTTEYRQEINTLSVGCLHYLAFDRLEPFFGAEAIARSMDDLKETIRYSETNRTTGELVYSSVEKVRYKGGMTYGFAPLLGFRYRVVCDLYLNAEFAPTWTWGSFGETRSSVSEQLYPDQFTYVNQSIAGGTSGGPYFLPRFGAGFSYRFTCKAKAAESPAAPAASPAY